MVPIAYISESINKELFKGLIIPEAECTSVYTATERGDIYLQINNINFTNEIEKIRVDRISPGTEGFINLQKGIYLATVDKKLALEEVLTFIHSETEAPLRWKKNSMELIRIETINDIWWENIRWETKWEIRMGRQVKEEGRPDE